MNISELLIDESKNLIEAMAQLDRVAKKILFVVDGNKLVASLTDGDIRRWILKKGSLEAVVKEFANYKPKFLNAADESLAYQYMIENHVEAIPILDDHHQIIDVIHLSEKSYKKRGHLTAPVVIMAGGMGTRLYPYTKILPKPLIPIDDLPIVEHIINRFYDNGCDRFHLVVNHKKNMIKSYFNDIERAYRIDYVDEEQPLGTGGGLSLLKGKINQTFFLSNCDILIDENYEEIFAFHKQFGNLITMVCSMKNIKIPYGVVEINESGEIESMQEKPSLTFFTNTGLYVVEPEIIEALNDNEAVAFPDIIENYKNNGKKVGVYPISENSWLDMGQFDEMDKMRRRLEKEV